MGGGGPGARGKKCVLIKQKGVLKRWWKVLFKVWAGFVLAGGLLVIKYLVIIVQASLIDSDIYQTDRHGRWGN